MPKGINATRAELKRKRMMQNIPAEENVACQNAPDAVKRKKNAPAPQCKNYFDNKKTLSS